VSDVTEAHDRIVLIGPPQGLEAALAEIAKYRGIYYNPAVVDACLHLSATRNFSLGG